MKDYLGFENARNKQNAALYTEIMRRAFGVDVKIPCDVLIGHHLTFELGKDLNTENEIPSADCLMFDHDVMLAVFGDRAYSVMMHLAAVPVPERDNLLRVFLATVPAADIEKAA